MQQFTTEFYEENISVVLIDTTDFYSNALQERFEQRQLSVSVFEADCDVLLKKEAYLEQAYKIVICLSPTLYRAYTPQLLEQLAPFQEKIVLLIPLVSACKLLVPGEVPFLKEVIESQNELVALCNELLPNAIFVFGQDTLSYPGMGNLFDLLAQQIQQYTVFSPTVTLSPHTFATYCDHAVEQILHPHRVSCVVRGKTRSSKKLLQLLVENYEHFFFCDVAVQYVEAEEQETIPFTTKEIIAIEDEQTIVGWYAKQLASPEQPQQFQLETLSYLCKSQDRRNKAPESTVVGTTSSTESEEELLPAMPQDLGLTTADVPHTLNLEKPEESVITPGEIFISMSEKKEKAPLFNISSEVQRIFATTREEKKVERATTLVKTQSRIQKKTKKRTILFYGGLAFTGMGLGVLLLMAVFMTSFFFLKKSLVTVLDVIQSDQQVTTSQWNNLKRFRNIVAAQASSYEFFMSLPQLEEAKYAISASTQLPVVTEQLQTRDKELKKLILTILGNDSGDIGQIAENVGRESLSAHESIASIENDLGQISFRQNSQIESAVSEFQKEVTQLEKQSNTLQQLQPILLSLFGVNQKRTYALLLQNNQELRPTGGFIEAVAMLTFERGVLIDHQIYTSYEVHKKLPGEVTAPAELTKATGEKAYFFHDSNWNPDFPKTAEQVSWFIEKAFNTKIDGVATIDLYGLQKILEATGPVDVPEFNEVLTHKNLLERMEFHSEVVLVESSKNQDYRKLIFSKILENVLSIKEGKIPALLTALDSSLNAQDALLSFKESDEQQAMQGLGWTGAQVFPRCPSEFNNKQCFVDSFMQVEANVGVNKANYYLQRTIDHTITLSPTLASHTRAITLKNTAQLDAWPKGSYKNYMRFYLPSQAQQVSIASGGIPVPESQITKTQYNGQLVLGVLFEVPIKTTKQVVITYNTPLSSTETGNFSYIFFNREQPGNGETPFLLRILPDSQLHPELITPHAEVASDGIVFTKNNDATGIYGVQFSQAN